MLGTSLFLSCGFDLRWLEGKVSIHAPAWAMDASRLHPLTGGFKIRGTEWDQVKLQFDAGVPTRNENLIYL
ncbi:MAG: hypothetical protein C4530_11745 [Desulfobacteraceae bacterium]|nr:MAG: hypothetical protein C4530_11745 [Desulfobacteraceae bacterium]